MQVDGCKFKMGGVAFRLHRLRPASYSTHSCRHDSMADTHTCGMSSHRCGLFRLLITHRACCSSGGGERNRSVQRLAGLLLPHRAAFIIARHVLIALQRGI